MKEQEIYNVLFLCTGNSARSILAEAILNRRGEGRFRAYSAGSQPAGTVNPFAVTLLKRLGYQTARLASKSWDEFASPGAPQIDFVFTVCDNAGQEVCPIWPGHPMTAHWGIADPAAITGTDEQKHAAFETAYDALNRRIKSFLELPLANADQASLRRRLNEIGEARMQNA